MKKIVLEIQENKDSLNSLTENILVLAEGVFLQLNKYQYKVCLKLLNQHARTSRQINKYFTGEPA